MTEPPAAGSAPPTTAPPKRRRLSLRVAWPLLLALPVFAASLWFSRLLMIRFPAGVLVPWAVAFLLSLAGVLVLAAAALRLVLHWHRPTRRAIHLLGLIRAGQAPIDELSHVGGGLRPLVQLLQDILRDLRRLKADLAVLDDEIRQRIARRTDALERTIGSLRQLASRDPLTGLHNRRALEQHLPDLIRQHQADHTPLCLLLMDLDNFKHLNDRRGHAAGDEFLLTIAQLIRSTVRDSDLAFRWGGDEFIALLPGCPRHVAQVIATRLASLADAAGQMLHLTPAPGLSVGLAMLDDVPNPTAVALLSEADRRLYAAKTHRHAQPRRTRITA